MYDEFDRTFKDDLADDICQTFIDVDEFAELVWVDGVLIPCQVVHYTADKSNRKNETYEGLHGDFTTLFFNAAGYMRKRERLPRHGEEIYINGKCYYVVSVKNEMGMAKIVCSSYRQNTIRTHPFKGDDPYGGLNS